MTSDIHCVSSALASIKGIDYLSCDSLSSKETLALLELASQLKRGERRIDLGNRILGLIFNKASTRTRVSFQVAIARLGGQTVDLNPKISQLGRGEEIKDTARVLSRFCDVLAIRTYGQDEIDEYAHWASIPVINALTDLEHPCQALADFLTLQEAFGKDLTGLTLAYVGDGNNVAHSLMICGALLGVNVYIATPKGFEPNQNILFKANNLASSYGAKIQVFNDPFEAVRGANALYTDVWASMGQENEQKLRSQAFSGFCLDQKLLNEADKKAIVLHCLPAHREEEITTEVLEGNASRIFDQAENRLHVQQSLLAATLGGL